jgi:hypothetical protein
MLNKYCIDIKVKNLNILFDPYIADLFESVNEKFEELSSGN